MTRPALQFDQLRRRAEAQIAHGNVPTGTAVDPNRALHELQVHRIELEMQNEDLISANRELEATRLRYQSLFDLAPMGYCTVSLHGAVLELNDHALRMLGGQRGARLDKPMRERFTEMAQPAFDALLRDAAASTSEVAADNLQVKRPHGVPLFVRAQARLLPASAQEPAVILLALMDVTALKFAMDDIAGEIDKRSAPGD